MNIQGLIKLLEQTDEDSILQIMSDDSVIKNFESYEFQMVISSLTEEKRTKILMDMDLIKNKLHLENFQIVELIKGLSSDNSKDQAMGIYQFEDYYIINILKTCSDKYKLDKLLQEKHFHKFDILDIVQTLDTKSLIELLVEQKEFCTEKKIHPYEAVRFLNREQQIDFVSNLENMNFTPNEKKEILVTLPTETKRSLNITNLPEEYKIPLSIKTTEYDGRVILNLERNLEDYRGLDNLIIVNPEKLTEEQRKKFTKACDICPNMTVFSTLEETVTFAQTASEYKEAEEWINSVIDNLNPEYSNAQKMAVIDNAIGKKISYSPDFATEVFDNADSRALWKIICSGYGVCNGIAKVEQYMFNRIGIESEIISSGTHAFLKIKDIELPLSNGEIAKGNTILDPTWNLTRHRFGGKPDNFCISYEQARKNDIDREGKEHNCHKNDEKLQDATLSLDEQSLRDLFTSVGLAGKDGIFPIKDLVDKSKAVDELLADQPEQNINKQFLLLKKVCPEFTTCQNSSMTILSDVLLSNENLKFNKCVVDRVYNREDKEKRPIMFVYIDSEELGEKFYFADKVEGQLVEISEEEFVKQFECYERDLQKNKRN